MQPTKKQFELIASEFDWEVSPGKIVKAWGFNNAVPGPVLRVSKGDEVTIKVVNNLAEPTTIHWHGIRLQSEMDGTTDTQKPIQPGEQFEYRFTVPDGGTFWYHSHHNETVQMERGLYGALIVEEETELVVDAEKVLVIDDMKLTKENEFKKGGFVSRWFERHDGREGDTLLINGKEYSEISMNAGQVERWRIVNASSAKYFHLSLSGRPFKIIGTDGGLLEAAVEASDALIIPGERLEILVGPFNEHEHFFLESLPYNRMTSMKPKNQQYAIVEVGERKTSAASVPSKLRTIEALASPQASITRSAKFSVVPSWRHGIDFTVNGEMHNSDDPVNLGELQVWEVANTSLMDHPFHLHGFFFQVLEENGKMPAYKAWKDTYNLKPRSRVKIAWMPDRTGQWMYHCHIIEHHEAGMMAHFEVVDPKIGRLHEHHAHSGGHY